MFVSRAIFRGVHILWYNQIIMSAPNATTPILPNAVEQSAATRQRVAPGNFRGRSVVIIETSSAQEIGAVDFADTEGWKQSDTSIGRKISVARLKAIAQANANNKGLLARLKTPIKTVIGFFSRVDRVSLTGSITSRDKADLAPQIKPEVFRQVEKNKELREL